MALARNKFREIVLQLLYSSIFFNLDEINVIPFMMRQIKTTKKNILMALEYAKKVHFNVKKFDEIIKKNSISYDLDRISKVELCALRLAIYEMQFEEKIPMEVSIAEAIRLTKKFGNKQSISYINAVLNAVKNQTLCN